MKQIAFETAALRQRRKLTPAARAQIDAAIALYAASATGNVKAMQGSDEYRLRSGDYRVIFTIEGDTITIRAVGHRRDIYR